MEGERRNKVAGAAGLGAWAERGVHEPQECWPPGVHLEWGSGPPPRGQVQQERKKEGPERQWKWIQSPSEEKLKQEDFIRVRPSDSRSSGVESESKEAETGG